MPLMLLWLAAEYAVCERNEGDAAHELPAADQGSAHEVGAPAFDRASVACPEVLGTARQGLLLLRRPRSAGRRRG